MSPQTLATSLPITISDWLERYETHPESPRALLKRWRLAQDPQDVAWIYLASVEDL